MIEESRNEEKIFYIQDEELKNTNEYDELNL
jgi:hypothetical protein